MLTTDRDGKFTVVHIWFVISAVAMEDRMYHWFHAVILPFHCCLFNCFSSVTITSYDEMANASSSGEASTTDSRDDVGASSASSSSRKRSEGGERLTRIREREEDEVRRGGKREK